MAHAHPGGTDARLLTGIEGLDFLSVLEITDRIRPTRIVLDSLSEMRLLAHAQSGRIQTWDAVFRGVRAGGGS